MTAPPYPPGDIASRTPRVAKLPAGALLHRFYTLGYDPIHFAFGPDGRLNAPDRSYGVLYAAAAVEGAFAETFLRQPGRRMIPADLLAKKGYARLRLTREAAFVVLAGPGLGVLGATAEVTHGGSYDLPQAWSAALHAHPIRADGVAYHARHDDVQMCFALFDRARAAVVESDRNEHLDDAWFWTVADGYEVGRAPV